MGSPVVIPKELQMLAMTLLAERKANGYTFDELDELRDGMRDMAIADLDDFRKYLEAEMLPILERRRIVAEMVARIKAKLKESTC